jgi:hypothetical protein
MTFFGCGSEPATSGPAVRDSASVTIVENSTPSWPESSGWRLAAEPSLDIGRTDGDSRYQLYKVVGAFKLSDGRVVVANSGTRELRYYDAAGRFLSASGRKGGGPGEFKDILWIRCTRGDSLLVYDWRARRVSLFNPAGEFVRAFVPEVLTTTGGFPVVAGPFSDGTLLLATETRFASGEVSDGTQRDSTIYYRLNTDGATIDTLGVFPGGESYVKTEGENRMGGGLVFGKFGQAAVTGDGFYYGSADALEFGYYDLSGRLRRLVRLDRPNLEVTQADIDRYVAERLETARDKRQRELYQKIFADMPFPNQMPAYSEFIVDSKANIWVGEYRKPGDQQPRWLVFDRAGALLGTVETPPRFRIYQIGADFVLGRWSDALDVEHVQQYALLKD